MNGHVIQRFALWLVPLAAVCADDHLAPHQRAMLDAKTPPPAGARFSFDAPAGPQFAEAEMEAQRARGRTVLPLIITGNTFVRSGEPAITLAGVKATLDKNLYEPSTRNASQ